MSTDGKQLENLVAFVEEKLLPPGFEVRPNARVFNEEGVQIAEFDIEIRGKVGTTTIAWLIECRDRPGHGAAPGSWIEQLVGRRTRFGFNKVTAVSTTGFTAGATEFARTQGIELREARSLDPTEFADWLHISAMHQIRRVTDLKHANIFLAGDAPNEAQTAAMEILKRADGNASILVSSTTGARATLTEAFFGAIQLLKGAFDEVTPEKPRPVSILGDYVTADHFSIETPSGFVRVSQIEFLGELRIEEFLIPVTKTVEYRHAETNEPISQLAAFAPHSVLGMNLAVELHRMADSGVTHVMVRRLPNNT